MAMAVAGLFLVLGQAGRYPCEAQVLPGKLVLVTMIDVSATEFKFEPGVVTVQPGDTLRFVQKSVMPHNVEFIGMPAESRLGKARVGPYLVKKQERYDLVIDARFAKGGYSYVCTPHAELGMVGTFTVKEGLGPVVSAPPDGW